MTLNQSKIESLFKQIATNYLTQLGYNEITTVVNSFIYNGKSDNMKTTQVYCKLTNVDNTELWSIDEERQNLLEEFATSNIRLVRIEGIVHDNYDVTDLYFHIVKDL